MRNLWIGMLGAAALLGGCADDDSGRPDVTETADGLLDVPAEGGADADAAPDAPSEVDPDVPAEVPADVPADVDPEASADEGSEAATPVGCSIAGEAVYESPITEAVSFVATADALPIHGTLFIPEAGGHFATVVLQHRVCTDRGEWSLEPYDLADALARRGFLVFAYDLRGHGESTGGGTIDVCGTGVEPAEFLKMPDDLADAVAFLETRSEADLSCLGVGGSSIGANIALIHGATEPRVLTVVLLSPGLNYMGLQPAPALPAFEPRPSLMLATDGDSDSANAVVTLDMAGDHVTGEVLTGIAHGAEIFIEHPAAFDQVLAWFSERL